jgi:hypothetical protein
MKFNLLALSLCLSIFGFQSGAVASGNGIERFEIPKNLSIKGNVLEKLNSAINFRCGHRGETAHLIEFKSFNVKENSIDQGITDYVIQADLVMHIDPSQLNEGVAYDQGHSMITQDIKITWSEYAINNPAIENFELNQFISTGCFTK